MSSEDDYKGVALDLANTIDYSAGSVISKTLLNKKTGTLTLFSFDAGQSLSEHTSPYDATVHIIEGKANLIIGGTTVSAGAGELVIMPANVAHSVEAEERFKMLLIMIR